MAEEETKHDHILQAPSTQVTEPPKFDLETYTTNYDPPTKLDRLTHIGLTSTILSRDALLAAQSLARSTNNLPRYLAISDYLTRSFPKDPQCRPDDTWVNSVTAQTNAETIRLENELKGYKNNLIKESIRMAQEDLGSHQFNTGQLADANRSYSRMREFCTTQAHLAYMHLRIALVAIAQQNWMNLQVCVSRIQSQTSFGDYAKIAPAIRPLLGLASMMLNDYNMAAQHLLSADPAFTQPMDPLSNTIVLNRIALSPNDVATYGALCALATLSRSEIQAQILDSAAPFRQFLELEPHMRRALTAFASGKYTQCLQTLSQYKVDWYCDAYLHRHIDALLTLVRRKCIVEYFKPFSAVTVAAMAEAFGTNTAPPASPQDINEMTSELIAMIEGELLHARLDAVAGLLVKPPESAGRVAAAEKALKAADEQERSMRLRLWRTEMLSCGLEVKGNEKRLPHVGGWGTGGFDAPDAWK